MVKKTPTLFEVKIKRKYDYWLHSITSFYEHCVLLAEMEENKCGVSFLQDLEVFDEKSFQNYTIECKSFNSLYLTGSEGGKDLNAAKNQATPKGVKAKIIKSDPRESGKVFNKKTEMDKLILKYIIFDFKRAYISSSFTHFCLFPAEYINVPSWSPYKNLICTLSLLVLKVKKL